MKLTVVGRNPQEANLVLNSQFVSSYHAEIIQLDNGDIYLVDKSSNGTFVDGARIPQGKEVQVQRGQNVSFADVPLNWGDIENVRIPANVKQMVSIGSHYANDIKIQGNAVSRFHATMRQMKDGKWTICDHSKNGTTVNGKRIPKNNYVEVKAGDEIVCAGFPIQNPIKKKSSGGLIAAIVGGVVAVAAVVVLIVAGPFTTYTDEEIFNKYNSSLALIRSGYHFEVTCGSYDLTLLPDPDSWNERRDRYDNNLYTSFIIKEDEEGKYVITYYDQTREGHGSMTSQATAFFIGNDGYLATNRHVARPWEALSNSMSINSIETKAEELYRIALTELVEKGYTQVLPLISQIKVEGKLDYLRAYPNNRYFDAASFENSINCMVAACSSEEEDVALLKLRNALPASVKPVPVSKISSSKIASGNHILVMGFPFGTSAQNINKDQLQALVNTGVVSQNNNKIWFGFDAATYNGASGSPIFDNKCRVVGVLNSGSQVQGFNRGIRSEYLYELVKKEGVK